MKRLIDPRRNPVGGWVFYYEPTKHHFGPFKSPEELIERVRAYINLNNYPEIKDLPYVIEDYVCNQPGNERRCTKREKFIPARTNAQRARGAAAAAKMVYMGDKSFVSRELAEARAKVCVGCPFNVPDEMKGIDAAANEMLKKLTGQRITEEDKRLGVCGVCTCPLKSKVHMKRSLFEDRLSAEEKRALPKEEDGKSFTCWMVKDPVID